MGNTLPSIAVQSLLVFPRKCWEHGLELSQEDERNDPVILLSPK